MWLAGVFSTGLLLSLALFIAVRNWQQAELDQEAAELVSGQIEQLQIKILRSMEVLHSIASLHAVEGAIDRRMFHEFVQAALARQPELHGLSWNPYVPRDHRRDIESNAVSNGLEGFQLRQHSSSGHLIPAPVRDDYVPVYWIEPLEKNLAAVGFDLISDECRRRSIEQARDSGQPTATPPVRLAQEPADATGFLVLMPVYQDGRCPDTIAERRSRLAGFAVAVFRVSDLVDGAFSNLAARGIQAGLFDGALDGEKLYGTGPGSGGRTMRMEVAGRQWAMEFTPGPEFLARHPFSQSWLVLVAGLAFTLLASGYLCAGWCHGVQMARVNESLEAEVAVRKRAESAAESANRAKSDFLASMSHEIRTPLNAILGYTHLMQRDPGLSGEQRDAVAGVSANGRHLLGLINEILDLSKIEAGRMELHPIDFSLAALARGLETTFAPLCARQRIGFRVKLDPPCPSPLHGDEGKLRQVLINLIGNAVKFTQTGEVCFQCRHVDDNSWLFEVIDTGMGIPAEEHADIFEPFHQGSGARHQGGTGLGLAIAQRQVRLLGGELAMESERGVGSRFHFTLALPPAKAARAEAVRIASHLKPGCSIRALVVDDRRDNRDILAGMLASVGCQVRTASGGPEAFGHLERFTPDIVFMDLLMPGEDGLTLARRMRARAPRTPLRIVALTAAVLPSLREAALSAGCVEFLPKPAEPELICDCLKRHLGVEFEYSSPAGDGPALPPLADLKLSLDRDLETRLLVAAELHSTTALKAALQDLRTRGPQACLLADHVRHLMRSYDMDEIQRVLGSALDAGIAA